MRLNEVIDILCRQIRLLCMLLHLEALHISHRIAIWVDRLHEEGKLNSCPLDILFNLLPLLLVIIVLLPRTISLL